MPITVEVIVNSTMEKVWQAWVTPKHIKVWNNASSDWHTTNAEVDLRAGGEFLSRMEARDGSVGFDFKGKYQKIINHQLIEYVLDDGRKVKITFAPVDSGIKVTETFDAEKENPIAAQKDGWQSILNNFADYVESMIYS